MLSNIRAKQKRICSAHVYPTTKIGLLLKNIYTMNVGQKSQKLDTTHTQNSNVAASLRLQLTHSMIHKPPCLGVLWKHRKKKNRHNLQVHSKSTCLSGWRGWPNNALHFSYHPINVLMSHLTEMPTQTSRNQCNFLVFLLICHKIWTSFWLSKNCVMQITWIGPPYWLFLDHTCAWEYIVIFRS